jgi:hypothetical protein
MDIRIPTALKALSTGGAATKSITSWWKKSKGYSRALIGELSDNLSYLDRVVDGGVPLGDVADKLSVAGYRRLSKEGFNLSMLKTSQIPELPSLQGTDLERWGARVRRN